MAITPLPAQGSASWYQWASDIDTAARAAGSAATISDGGTWTTGVAYTPGKTVTKSGVRYECAIAHTAGTFATDLSAGKWVTLGVDPSSATTLPADAAGWLHDDGAGVMAWTTPTAAQVGADASGAATTAQAFAIQRANHTGTQAASTITGLATVATTGAYTDLSGKPVVNLTPTAKTAAYTAVDGDLVLGNATTAAFTVTLPTPTAGRRIGVRKVDASANAVTVTASSGTIDGAASWAFGAQWQTQVYVADGTNWQRLDVPGVQAIAATGTASSTTYLRGDGTWSTPAGGGSSLTVQDEGSALTVRSTINFVGAGVTATDDAANSRTLVTIPGGSGGSAGTSFRGVLPTGTLAGAYVESFPRFTPSATGLALTSGQPRLSAITLRAGEVVTSMMFVNGGTSLAGGTHQWAALADLSGNVLAVSADDTGAANWSLSAAKTFTMTSAYTVPTSGVYYAALCVVATTPPTPMVITGNANLLSILTPFVAATSTTNTGAPPAVAASLGTVTASTNTGFVAIA